MQVYNTHIHPNTNETNLNLDFSSGSTMGGMSNLQNCNLWVFFPCFKLRSVWWFITANIRNRHICLEHSFLHHPPTIHHGHLWVPRSTNWLPNSITQIKCYTFVEMKLIYYIISRNNKLYFYSTLVPSVTSTPFCSCMVQWRSSLVNTISNACISSSNSLMQRACRNST